MSKLASLRNKLKKEQQKFEGGDPSSYPFWNIQTGKSCTIRFLPDGDESNDFFWRERQLYRWEFTDPNKPEKKVRVVIPCIETWDGTKSCPIANELRGWFKAKEEEDLARKLWPKKSFIYQGFVRKSDFTEENPPENSIRIFHINKSIHNFIKETLLSDDEDTAFEEMPTDFENGRDLVIKKTQNGEYASYATSQWANNMTPLREEEVEAIEQHGLFNLSDKLPERPSDDAYAVAVQMFEALVDDNPWDPEWEKHWKPIGDSNDKDDGDSDKAVSQKEPSTKTKNVLANIKKKKGADEKGEDDAPEAEATTEASSEDQTSEASDEGDEKPKANLSKKNSAVLARLRQKQQEAGA